MTPVCDLRQAYDVMHILNNNAPINCGMTCDWRSVEQDRFDGRIFIKGRQISKLKLRRTIADIGK